MRPHRKILSSRKSWEQSWSPTQGRGFPALLSCRFLRRIKLKSVRTGFLLIVILVYFNTLAILPILNGTVESQRGDNNNSVKTKRDSLFQSVHCLKPEPAARKCLNHLENCTRDVLNQTMVLGNGTRKATFLSIAILVDGLESLDQLEGTLVSILLNSVDRERDDVIIIIYLGDHLGIDGAEAVKDKVSRRFKDQVTSGFFQVVHSAAGLYSTQRPQQLATTTAYQGLLPGGTTSYLRVNDFAFVFMYCHEVLASNFFMTIPDDATLAKGFITEIRSFITTNNNNTWLMLDFSTVDFSGKLYRHENLPELAHFVMFFSDLDQSMNTLYQYYADLRLQRRNFLKTSSVFHRIHRRTSLVNKTNELRYGLADNPAGKVYSTLEPFSLKHKPQFAYGSEAKYFYGKFPQEGDTLVLIFNESTPIVRVSVKTGTRNPKDPKDVTRDILLDGVLELSAQLDKGHSKNGIPKCREYKPIAYTTFGLIHATDVEQQFKEQVACLRIRVLSLQVQWLAVREISVWTHTDT